jgi:hypothetical protein
MSHRTIIHETHINTILNDKKTNTDMLVENENENAYVQSLNGKMPKTCVYFSFEIA